MYDDDFDDVDEYPTEQDEAEFETEQEQRADDAHRDRIDANFPYDNTE